MEIANLTRLVEQGSGLALGEESTLNDLIKQKEELVRERDAQVDQIMAIRAELMDTQVQVGKYRPTYFPGVCSVWYFLAEDGRLDGPMLPRPWCYLPQSKLMIVVEKGKERVHPVIDTASFAPLEARLLPRTAKGYALPHGPHPQEKLRGADNSKLQLEADNQALRDAVAEKKMEAERESRKKERMEKEMKELRVSLEARQSEIKAKQQQVGKHALQKGFAGARGFADARGKHAYLGRVLAQLKGAQ
eukprot:1157480-Pelagomonas_calceolata.AAC.7